MMFFNKPLKINPTAAAAPDSSSGLQRMAGLWLPKITSRSFPKKEPI